MKLTTNVSSDKIYCYATPADFSDEEIRAELLGVRFTTVESLLNSQLFFSFHDLKLKNYKKKFHSLIENRSTRIQEKIRRIGPIFGRKQERSKERVI